MAFALVVSTHRSCIERNGLEMAFFWITKLYNTSDLHHLCNLEMVIEYVRILQRLIKRKGPLMTHSGVPAAVSPSAAVRYSLKYQDMFLEKFDRIYYAGNVTGLRMVPSRNF